MPSEQIALPVSTPGSVTAFRYCSYDVPFWARQNSRPGRWHQLGDPPTQYWSLSPDAAWAELIRAENLETEDELDLVRMPLWVCRVPMLGLVDLTDTAQQDRYQIDQHQMIADDWRPCQAASAALRRDAPGIMSYSAALDGHFNITIFGARRAIDWRRKPALASTAPAAIAAIGRPPAGLIEHVRLRSPEAPQPSLF